MLSYLKSIWALATLIIINLGPKILRYSLYLLTFLAVTWLFETWVSSNTSSNHYLFCASSYIPSLSRTGYRDVYDLYIERAIEKAKAEGTELTKRTAEALSLEKLEMQTQKWLESGFSNDEIVEKIVEIRQNCSP